MATSTAARLKHSLEELCSATSIAGARAAFQAAARDLTSAAVPWKSAAPAAADLLARPGPRNAARYHLGALAQALDKSPGLRAAYHARSMGHLLFPDDAAWQPTVSIVIPLHDRSDLAVRSVQSCIEQTWPHVEIIVVDDGSTDDPAAHLKPLLGRIRLVRQPHRGVSAARNHGLRLARGDFVHFLDADDCLSPDSLAAKLSAFREIADADLCTSLYDVQGDNGTQQSFSRRISPLGDAECPTRDFMSTVVRRFAMSNCTVLAPRWVWSSIGPFDEDLRQGEDVRYWFRAAVHGVKVVGLRRTLSTIHLNPGSLTTRREENLRYCGIALLRNAADVLATPSTWRYAEAFFRQCWDEALETMLRDDDEESATLRRRLSELVRHVPHIAAAWSAKPRTLLRAIESVSRSRGDVARLFADTRTLRTRMLREASPYRRQKKRRRMDDAGLVAVLPWKPGVVSALRRLLALSSAPRGVEIEDAALVFAAGTGETDAVERLLVAGVDPNVRDRHGETPLHRAVRRGHEQTAACLLAYGADHSLADNDGRTPLDPAHTSIGMLHAVRQRHRRFRPRLKTPAVLPSPQAAHWLYELELLGITRIPGLIEPDVLERLRTDFAGFIGSLERKLARGEGRYRHYDEEEHLWEADSAYVCNNAFKYSTELIGVSRHETVTSIVDAYFGEPAFITRANAMRYLPIEERHNDMFGWHHDMEDSRVKMMVLLTDVGENDQHMSYVLRSHSLYHPYEMFLRNECSLDYCRRELGSLEMFHTIGNAGDVFLFDSNGAHRGRRRPDAATRDAMFVEYTTDDSDVWGGDLSREGIESLSPRHAEAFRRMLAASKKWAQPVTRTLPTWAENLPRIETWARRD